MDKIQYFIDALKGNTDQPQGDQGSLYNKNPLANVDFQTLLRQIGNNAYGTLRNVGTPGAILRAGIKEAGNDPMVQRLSFDNANKINQTNHTLSQAPEDYKSWSLGGEGAQTAGNLIGDPLNYLGLGGPAISAIKTGAKELAPTAGRMAENYMFDNGLALSAIPKGKAKAMQKLIASVDPTTLSESDQMLLNTFGSKAEREAKTAKKVEKQTLTEKVLKTVERGEKLPPDYFRQLEANQGEQEVLNQAAAGKHLKPTSSGGYVGAPRTVDSPQSLGAMRSNFDTQFDNAANAIAVSDDPSRVGTWYDRAKEGQAASNETYQLPRSLEQHSVYSAGVTPEAELGFSLKHLNSRILGEPEMAYRGAPMRNLDTAVAEDRPANLAFKIKRYGHMQNPDVPNEGLFGTNDFRHAQSFGYTDPAGNPWRAGVSDTMHPVMDAETALAVKRANESGVGNRSDWNGAHLQEMPWVLNKAEDFYGRGFNAKYKSDNPVEGMKQAIREANNTMADYIPKHTISATWEAIPGASTGHVPSILTASPEEKLAYTNRGRWDVEVPTMNTASGNVVGAGNRDAIYSALGFRQMPTQETTGAYLNAAGQMEHNPLKVGNVMIDFKKGSHDVEPRTMGAIGAAEQFRALQDAQEAGAANLLRTTAGTGKSSILLEGQQPTKEQMAKIVNILKGTNLTPANSSRGVSLMDFSGKTNLTNKVMKQKTAELNEAYPSKMLKATRQSVYEPALTKLDSEGKPIPTIPGSGEATAAMLERFAKETPEVARKISESETVRNIIKEKIARDNELALARPDIQKTRKFFSEANWNKVVELIRQGMPPAAALGALGFSLEGMAAEKDR